MSFFFQAFSRKSAFILKNKLLVFRIINLLLISSKKLPHGLSPQYQGIWIRMASCIKSHAVLRKFSLTTLSSCCSEVSSLESFLPCMIFQCHFSLLLLDLSQIQQPFNQTCGHIFETSRERTKVQDFLLPPRRLFCRCINSWMNTHILGKGNISLYPQS